jgi:hypothetical protein
MRAFYVDEIDGWRDRERLMQCVHLCVTGRERERERERKSKYMNGEKETVIVKERKRGRGEGITWNQIRTMVCKYTRHHL